MKFSQGTLMMWYDEGVRETSKDKLLPPGADWVGRVLNSQKLSFIILLVLNTDHRDELVIAVNTPKMY